MLGTALPLETGNHPREKLLISMEQFKLWRRHIILLGGLPNTSLVVTVWTITHNCYCGWMYTGRRNFTVLGSASASKEDLLTDSLQESSCLDSLGGHVSALVLVNWRLVTLGTKTTYGSFVHCFRYAKVQSDFGIIEWQVSTVLVLSFYKKLKNHPYLIQHFYCNSRLRYWRRHSLNNPIFVHAQVDCPITVHIASKKRSLPIRFGISFDMSAFTELSQKQVTGWPQKMLCLSALTWVGHILTRSAFCVSMS